MKLEQIKQNTKETVDEISKAAKAHVALAKDQYGEYKTRHGDPVEKVSAVVREPLNRGRERARELGKELNERTDKASKELADRTSDVAEKVTRSAEDITRRVNEVIPVKRERSTDGGAKPSSTTANTTTKPASSKPKATAKKTTSSKASSSPDPSSTKRSS